MAAFDNWEKWLARLRRFWSARIDALERHLDDMDQLTPRNGKAKR